MGGQDCKAINCDNKGIVTNFVMNDKCAGGTGRFLEMIADVLNISLVKNRGNGVIFKINGTILIPFVPFFARTEAISCLRHGVAKPDISPGLNEAIAVRCLNLLKRVSLEKEFTITGGIAKNSGMVAKIKEKGGTGAKAAAPDPQAVPGHWERHYLPASDAMGMSHMLEAKSNTATAMVQANILLQLMMAGAMAAANVLPPAAQIFEIGHEGNGKQPVRVKESLRKRLAIVCPGFKVCGQKSAANCHSVCKKEAIGHSW